MSKVKIGLKILQNRHARGLVVKAIKNKKVRNIVVKGVTNRLLKR